MSAGPVVLALGGNAISAKSGTIDSQYEAISNATKDIAGLVKEGHNVVITHGNGPQVGDAIIRNESAKNIVPPLPLYANVAETQGMLGAMIQKALLDHLGEGFDVSCLVTKVTVSSEDQAFANPTKPVGPTLSRSQASRVGKAGVKFRQVRPGIYRRVVPSPDPVSISEVNAIIRLIECGHVVIACGGGGVPVTEESSFVNAVIDKDLASGLLAAGIGASLFASLSDVEGAYLDFRRRNRKLLRNIRVDRIKDHLSGGQFEEGSMEPKVRAAVRFTESTGMPAVIASLSNLKKAVRLRSGTVIYK